MPVRGPVWAALLNVTSDVTSLYAALDNVTETATDRQLAVDIPRCHQYDTDLASPHGHDLLRRVLKAWMVAHPNLVYWQGLDSLTAPFVKLNLTDEAKAYGCMAAFVDRFLPGFFLKDNSQVMQEFLAVFMHLLAFWDPVLAHHMHTLMFLPDLFAIPWFLTAFAHVFPLDKIFRIWDSFLLGNSGSTLCLGWFCFCFGGFFWLMFFVRQAWLSWSNCARCCWRLILTNAFSCFPTRLTWYVMVVAGSNLSNQTPFPPCFVCRTLKKCWPCRGR
jgi:hypothetical protein